MVYFLIALALLFPQSAVYAIETSDVDFSTVHQLQNQWNEGIVLPECHFALSSECDDASLSDIHAKAKTLIDVNNGIGAEFKKVGKNLTDIIATLKTKINSSNLDATKKADLIKNLDNAQKLVDDNNSTKFDTSMKPAVDSLNKAIASLTVADALAAFKSGQSAGQPVIAKFLAAFEQAAGIYFDTKDAFQKYQSDGVASDGVTPPLSPIP